MGLKTGEVKFLKGLRPYEIQRRTEYFIQGQSLVAQMMFTKITDLKGKVRSLWDAYDDNGEWKTNEFGEAGEWSDKGLEAETDNKFTRFRDKAIEVNKILHGNYDVASPTIAKKTLIGRMLFQYRSWMPEGFAQRFQDARWSSQLGRMVKGRWRTLGTLGFVESLRVTSKALLGSKSAYSGIDEAVDVENMRKNVAEMKIAIALYALGVMLRAGVDDDDDDNLMNYPARLLINQLWRVESDIYFYFSPATFKQILRDPIPVMKLYLDFERAMNASYRYIMQDDYKGDAPIIKWMQFFPFTNQLIKTQWLSENVIQK